MSLSITDVTTEEFADIRNRDDADTAKILFKNLGNAGGAICLNDSSYTYERAFHMTKACHQGASGKIFRVGISPESVSAKSATENAANARVYHEAALLHFISGVMGRAPDNTYHTMSYLRHLIGGNTLNGYLDRAKHHKLKAQAYYPNHPMFQDDPAPR